MDITANDFFRQQYFAATWNKEHMDKTTMSPNDCIKMMELYHEHKLKLLGIGDVVGQGEQLKCDCTVFSRGERIANRCHIHETPIVTL